MKLSHLFLFCASCAFGFPSIAHAQTDSSLDEVNWSEYMAEQDMMWKTLPKNWKESPFLGNGSGGRHMCCTQCKILIGMHMRQGEMVQRIQAIQARS